MFHLIFFLLFRILKSVVNKIIGVLFFHTILWHYLPRAKLCLSLRWIDFHPHHYCSLMKTKTRYLISVLLYMFALPGMGYACSCSPYLKAFCPSASERNHVVLAEVTDSISRDKRRIQIIDNIKKKVAFPEVILIGQDGLNCGENLEKFALGDTLIFALDQLTDTTYILSWCGRNYLQYHDNAVSGPIYTESDTIMQYMDFVEDIDACLLLVSAKEINKGNYPVKIFPNPFWNDLIVQMKGKEIIKIAIYSISGKLLISKDGNGRREIQLEMKGIEPGIYFARIYYKEGRINKKISKI